MILQFCRPALLTGGSWLLDKMGEPINPLHVNLNGSHHIHGIQDYVLYYNDYHKISFVSKDVSLVVPGEPTGFPTPLEAPNVDEGFSFYLCNNIWGTKSVLFFSQNYF